MRRLPAVALCAVLLGLAAPTARAELPVGYVGPTYFTDVAHGGPAWSIAATGSTVPVAPAEYGADPDVSATAAFAFSGADNAQGTLATGLAHWPRAFTPQPVAQNTRAVMGTSPAFMLAVQRRSVTDDFVVFVLDFAGDDTLAGDYATCGPAAFQANPAVIGSEGAPGYYDGPFYAEGSLVAKRGGTTPAAPAAPDELYGMFGAIGGESPYCDQARQTPALWAVDPAPPAPGNDTRRTTRTEVGCNRGPQPGDPFTCTATVADSDQRPGATAPTGPASLNATSGSLSASTCTLTPSPSSPATAACTFTYVNPDIGAGQEVPVAVSYHGDGAHKPSSGHPVAVVPPSTQPSTGGAPPVVCGAAPLNPCEGAVPAPNPVQTCVANTGGACINVNQQAAPIKVCIANVVTACAGFTGGAIFSGEIKEPVDLPMELRCPDVELLSLTPDYEACRATITMTLEQSAIVKQFDTLFKEEIRLRYAVWQAVNARGPEVKGHPDRYTVGDVARPSVERSIITHNARALEANALIDALSSKDRRLLGVGHLDRVDLDARLSRFPVYALGPDDNFYYDPRVLSLSSYTNRAAATAATAATAAAAARTPRKGYGPKRTKPVTGTVTVARSRTVLIKPGASAKVKVTFTQLGRALVSTARRHGRTRLRVSATVAMTSTGGRFAPTTVSRSFYAKLTKLTKLPKPKPKPKSKP